MSSFTQRSFPINPITGEQFGTFSHQESQTKQLESFITSRNQKSNLIKQNYMSIDGEELDKKVNQFLTSKHAHQKAEYNQYHDQYCVCVDCAYQRQLSKPSHTLFNLTMRSIYKKSFTNKLKQIDHSLTDSKLHKSTIEDFSAKKMNQKQSSIYPKNKITLQSIYNTEITGKTDQKTKIIKNDDNLTFEGPFQNITMYKQKFPGVRGQNPYVKPITKAVREQFKLETTTMNSTFYKGQFTERSKLVRSPDCIKTGLPMLFKETTSNRFYAYPQNPQNYNKVMKSSPKREQSPTDKHQFQSIYRNSFYGPDILESIKHKKRLVRQTMSKLGISG